MKNLLFGVCIGLLFAALSILLAKFLTQAEIYISPLICAIFLGLGANLVLLKILSKGLKSPQDSIKNKTHSAVSSEVKNTIFAPNFQFVKSMKLRINYLNECAKDGLSFCAKRLLRLGIVLYGINISLAQIAQVGTLGVIFCAIFVSAVLLGAALLGKILKADYQLAILVGAGCGICGAAAILAVESTLKIKPHKSASALAAIVVFGLLGMILEPIFLQYFGSSLKELGAGFFIGASLHEVANVVGAAAAVGGESGDFALIFKMLRVLFLVPVLLLLPLFVPSESSQSSFVAQDQNKAAFNLKNKIKTLQIPYFALFFLLVVILNSIFSLPLWLLDSIKFLSIVFLSAAMAALGLQIDFQKLLKNAKIAFVLCAILSVFLCILAFIFAHFLG